MRIRLFIVVSAVLSACAPAPEDPLFVFGSLQAPDGTPTSGTLTFERHACDVSSCTFAGDDEEDGFGPFRELSADPDGNWMLELTRFEATRYTQGGTSQRTFRVRAQPDPSLPPVEATYDHQSGDVDLPPLRQWDAQAQVVLNEAGDALRVSTTAPPPIPQSPLTGLPFQTERNGRYGIAFAGPEDGVTAWFEPATGSPMELPLEVLEDFTARWGGVATHWGPWFGPTLLAGQSQSTVTQNFPFQDLPVVAAHVPVSRGASCTMLDSMLEPFLVMEPCPYTDGKLEPAGTGFPGSLLVILETPAPLKLVVVRGVRIFEGSRLRIEAFDGTTWHPVTERESRPGTSGPMDGHDISFFVEVDPALGPIHEVRLISVEPPRTEDFYMPTGIVSAQEISLF